jgi:hypothetical protein
MLAVEPIAGTDLQLGRPSRTSSLVMHRPVTPLIWIERLSAATSSQPQRRLRPVTVPNFTAFLRHLVPWQTLRLDVEFAREGTAADARAIRLGDSQHVMQHARTDARTGGRLAGNAVRRGDKGIGAVIDVEQAPCAPSNSRLWPALLSACSAADTSVTSGLISSASAIACASTASKSTAAAPR